MGIMPQKKNAPEKDGDPGFRQLGMMETCEIILKSYESVHSDILKMSEESEGTKIDIDKHAIDKHATKL